MTSEARATVGAAATIIASHGRPVGVLTCAQTATRSSAPSRTWLTSTKVSVASTACCGLRSVPDGAPSQPVIEPFQLEEPAGQHRVLEDLVAAGVEVGGVALQQPAVAVEQADVGVAEQPERVRHLPGDGDPAGQPEDHPHEVGQGRHGEDDPLRAPPVADEVGVATERPAERAGSWRRRSRPSARAGPRAPREPTSGACRSWLTSGHDDDRLGPGADRRPDDRGDAEPVRHVPRARDRARATTTSPPSATPSRASTTCSRRSGSATCRRGCPASSASAATPGTGSPPVTGRSSCARSRASTPARTSPPPRPATCSCTSAPSAATSASSSSASS